jgi:hypothetical protein
MPRKSLLKTKASAAAAKAVPKASSESPAIVALALSGQRPVELGLR